MLLFVIKYRIPSQRYSVRGVIYTRDVYATEVVKTPHQESRYALTTTCGQVLTGWVIFKTDLHMQVKKYRSIY